MENIVIKRYSDEIRNDWNKYIYASKTPLFLLDRNYMEYHKDRFVDHSLIFYNKDEKIIGLLPANEDNGSFISHGGLTFGGFITDTDTKQTTVLLCFAALKEYLKENGFSELIYKPIPYIFHVQPAEEDRYSLYRIGAKLTEVAASTVIDLKNPVKMAKGRRAQISRAKREGVDIKILDSKLDYDRFIDLENEVLETKHGVKAVHTSDELFSLHLKFPQKIKLYGAFVNKKMIAGTVIYDYNLSIHTQYMATDSIGRTIGALDLLINSIINNYCNSKKTLDFGISTEDHGNILNEGLISQKEGFGGRTVTYERWTLQIK